jgi:hypothetical protein
MFHVVARSTPGTLLFHHDVEGRGCWQRLARVPGLVAACLMPDHVHLVLHQPADDAIATAMRAYARWRNHHRREGGPVWAVRPEPEPLPDAQHVQRTIRYVHLNPCRAGLTNDPLVWPFSTHRDAVGLAAPAVVPPHRDPEGFHAYVSGDPSAAVAGTPFPHGTWGRVSWGEVAVAVAGVCPVTVAEVATHDAARRLAVRTAWVHEVAGPGVLAAAAGLRRETVWRLCHGLGRRGSRLTDPALAACVRAVGESRLRPLDTTDLRRDPGVAAYRRRNRR